MAVGDVYRIVINGLNRSAPVTMRWFVEEVTLTGLEPRQVANELAVEFLARYRANFLPLHSKWFYLLNIVVNRVHPTYGPTDTRYALVTDVGGDTADTLPSNTALIISFQADQAGPSYRGRTYIAGIPQDDAAGGTLLQAAKASWDAAIPLVFQQFADTDTGEYNHVIFSRKLSVGTEVADYIVRPRVGTQRRRRLRNAGFAPSE